MCTPQSVLGPCTLCPNQPEGVRSTGREGEQPLSNSQQGSQAVLRSQRNDLRGGTKPGNPEKQDHFFSQDPHQGRGASCLAPIPATLAYFQVKN